MSLEKHLEAFTNLWISFVRAQEPGELQVTKATALRPRILTFPIRDNK